MFDLMTAKKDLIRAIGKGRTQRHRLADKGLAHFDDPVAEVDHAALLHLSRLVIGAVAGLFIRSADP